MRITRIGMQLMLLLLAATLLFLPVNAGTPPLTGAIFTSVADGSEVNYNIYADKNDVYLDGGPGPGAPDSAAGLPDGLYYFQVTDPSGKTLLSQDAAQCREFAVSGGIITGLVNNGCNHVTGTDTFRNNGAITIQLMPYADTPNPGGEYKVWVTPIDKFVCDPTGPDCGVSKSVKHGFVPGNSKTDNFKVKGQVLEVDTRFFPDYNGNGHKDDGEDWIDGLSITWHDTLGASNKKWSYLNERVNVWHEAHVEGPEVGFHSFDILDQDGCTVGNIFVAGSALRKSGQQTVIVNIRQNTNPPYGTIFIDVACR